MNEKLQSSKGMIKFIEIIEIKIIIKGRIYKGVLDNFLERENNPILWKNFFMKNVSDRQKRFIQNCRERRFCHFQLFVCMYVFLDNILK